MTPLQFDPSADAGTAFYRDFTERVSARLREKGATRYADRLMLWKVSLYFLATALAYGFLLRTQTLPAFYALYLLTGLLVLLTAFNVSHDAAHGVIVKNRRVNDWLFALSFHLQGNNGYVWKKYHNESHHMYTNVEGSDIDVLNNPLIRMTDAQERRAYHRYQHLYAPFLYLLYSLNWFFIRETLMLLGHSSRTIRVKIPLKEAVLLVAFKLVYLGYMIVLPYWLLDFSLGQVLLAFLLNHFMVSVIFTAVLGVSHLSDRVEHPEPDAEGRLPMSWPLLQLKTSVDYNSDSRFLNWTLGGFNAHTLHHLLPNVSHIHYLDILPILRQTAQEHGLTYNEMPYHQALASHFRFLKKMGRQGSEFRVPGSGFG